MIINHNMGALNANRMMNINSSNASKSMSKLSSGLRINSASDDAAGLAISEKMRGQINGLDKAASNAQDGISLLQTAEGNLNETTSILQRMRELAVQGSNDTLNSNDRGQIQKEMDQLTQEIDRIGNTTEFNTKKLLNGAANVSGTVDKAGVSIAGGTGETQAGATIVLATTTAATAATTASTAGTITGGALANASTVTINGVTFSFAAGDTTQNVLDTINNSGVGVKASIKGGKDLQLDSANIGSAAKVTIAGGTGDFSGLATVNGTDAAVTFTSGATKYTADGDTVTIQDMNGKGLQLKISAAATAVTVNVTNNGTLSFQIGANEGQMMNVGIGDMRAAALGVSGISVKDGKTATAAITTIQNAIDQVSTERSKLGAYTNRLEHTIANLGTSSENLTSSESRIRDVDMAKEMSTYSKNNILAQAAQAMLAQANQQPQQVLQLLR